MRLLMCIPYFAPATAFGGTVTVAETIAGDLVAAGHDVTVATTDVLDGRARVPRDTAIQHGGAEVMRFRNVSHRLAAGHNGYSPRGMRRWLAVNVGRFDLVLLQDVYSAVSVMAALAAQRAGVPYALQAHGTISTTERGRTGVKRAFMALWGRRTLAGAAALIHLTDYERGEYVAQGGSAERLLAVPQPVELPPPVQVAPAPHPTVAFVGQIRPIKGLDRLIEAVAIARRDVPDLRLEVAGPSTPLVRRLEALAKRLGIADAVRFVGFVDADARTRLFGAAQLSALLSDHEGLPVAVLEAMACGTPVVISKGCHLDEVDGRGGIVVDGDAPGAAAAIVALLGDESHRERLAAGARAFADDFRRETVMPRMAAALEALASGAGAGEAQAAADQVGAAAA